MIGKPNRIIIDELAQKLNLTISQLAMVGDRLYTDIALGQTSSITTVLVLSGETRLSDLDRSPYKPTCIFNDLGEVADYLLNILN